MGHVGAQATLERALAGTSLHHAWLFAGPEGVGKSLLAREFALRLLAIASDGALDAASAIPADHPQRHLFDKGSHPDFRILQREPKEPEKPEKGLNRNIRVDQVRALSRFLNTRPSMSYRRVLVIDSADDLEKGAANALLKMLEEPPHGTVFLLISHRPGRLLPTIRSRCRTLRFESLPDALVERIVRDHMADVDADELAALVRAGDGSPGRALRFAGLDLGALERDLAAAASSGDPDNVIRARLAKALASKTAEARYDAFLDRVPGFVAAIARRKSGAGLVDALDAYAETQRIAAASRGLTLDPQTTVFQLVGQVARLAH